MQVISFFKRGVNYYRFEFLKPTDAALSYCINSPAAGVGF
jgi:hypothetical protein